MKVINLDEVRERKCKEEGQDQDEARMRAEYARAARFYNQWYRDYVETEDNQGSKGVFPT